MIELQREGQGIVEPQRTLPVDGEYDVIVVGGGVAGCGAAIASARAGLRTLVIEWSSALGGLATMGLVNIPMDFVSGIGQRMFDELVRVQGLWHRNSDPEKHKLVLDRMVRAAGADVLLTTHVVDAVMEGDAIRGVVIESKSGREAILAQRVIDCSGDADAAAFAGCEFAVGREVDGLTQACSLEFRLGGVDWDRYSAWKGDDPRWEGLIKQALASGDLPYEVDNHLNWITHVPGRPEHEGVDEVSICLAHSRYCHPLDKKDLTRMYIEGREQADFLAGFIKRCVPGFERAWLVDTGSLLGVRDSRRIMGEYVLTASDIASARRFDDVVTISHHGYDIHHPTSPGNVKWVKMDVDGETRYVICHAGGYNTSYDPPGGKDALTNYWGTKEFGDRGYYDIPLRCLLPLKVDSLMVAGRCLSADFEAQSGSRLIMACMTMGEAAGTATALSLKQGVAPRKLDRVALQRTLVANGVNIGHSDRAIPGL